MPLICRTFLINFTIGRYDSHAVTIPLELRAGKSFEIIARAAIIDNKPVPALQFMSSKFFRNVNIWHHKDRSLPQKFNQHL